jgi:hypothetical protein
MSDFHDLERASALLSEQIEVLASLRNANTRDPNFKQWRQNALTAIQRIWPGDAGRSERFRRIPFTPPSSRAETKAVREVYERGCAEAVTYLRALLAELQAGGVPIAGAAPRPASLDPGVAEDDFPTLDLPGGPAPVAMSPAPPVTSMPTLPTAPAAPSRAPVIESSPAVKAAVKHAAKTAKGGRKNGSKARLKDMLGFVDEQATASHPEETSPEHGRQETPAPHEMPVPHAEEPAAPPPPAPAVAPLARVSPPEPEPMSADEQEREARELAAESLAAESDVERAMSDFLRMSPVLSSEARPVRRPAVTEPFNAPAALTLAAIAADIEALGVPEGHRARARAMLLDLARRIDTHDLPWDVLRDGVAFAMEFPTIGRRVLPLLVPYLDQAA